MLRIRAVTPIHVDAEELRRRQERYRRLSPTGIDITLVDIGDGADIPRALNTEAEIRWSEELMITALMATDPADFDLAMPDCVLDPGVGRGLIGPVPFVGLTQLTAHFIASLGQAFAAVTRNEAIGAELESRIRGYGLGDAFRGVRVLGLSVDDIPDDAAWSSAITTSVADLPVEAVINGCSAVEVRPESSGPHVVDPTELALRLLAVGHAAGVWGSAVRALQS